MSSRLLYAQRAEAKLPLFFVDFAKLKTPTDIWANKEGTDAE